MTDTGEWAPIVGEWVAVRRADESKPARHEQVTKRTPTQARVGSAGTVSDDKQWSDPHGAGGGRVSAWTLTHGPRRDHSGPVRGQRDHGPKNGGGK